MSLFSCDLIMTDYLCTNLHQPGGKRITFTTILYFIIKIHIYRSMYKIYSQYNVIRNFWKNMRFEMQRMKNEYCNLL